MRPIHVFLILNRQKIILRGMNTLHWKSIVVIGGGLAGAKAAEGARAAGFDGLIRLIGDEAHSPYERPPLSKALLTFRGGSAGAANPVEDVSELAFAFDSSSADEHCRFGERAARGRQVVGNFPGRRDRRARAHARAG